MKEIDKTIKEEINKELSSLILEVLHRLERENPELLKSLFPSLKDENTDLKTISEKRKWRR